jgi:Xaa-Pro dipeptidase
VDLDRLRKLYAEHLTELERAYAPILENCGFDGVLLHAGSIAKRTKYDDQDWPLRVTPHFQHWCPLAAPESAIYFEPGKKPVLYWYRPTSFWENPAPPETDHFLPCFSVVEVAALGQVRDALPERKKIAFIGENKAAATAWDLDPRCVDPDELVRALDALRVTKTAYEVLCLEEANRRAARGHRALVDAFWSGEHAELDLHLLYLRVTGQDDPETPYKNIVALGANAATLHHVSYGKIVPERAAGAQSLLVDAGAAYQGYCSDITRTWVKGSGSTASAFGGLVEAVEQMQQRLCAAVRLGLPYEELHDEAHRQVGEILSAAGIVKCGGEEAVASGATRAFFPHGLGHSLGLQCHDVGCALVKPKAENPYLRNTAPVAAGPVFTIEPGV